MRRWTSLYRKDLRESEPGRNVRQGGHTASPLPKRYGGRYLVGTGNGYSIPKPRIRKRKKK